MKKSIIFLFLVAGVQMGQAQLLKKITNKVKSAVEKTVDGNTEHEKKDSGLVVAASDKTAYRSKFDFVPGDKVVLWEDFGQAHVGDLPPHWTSNGGGETVTIDGHEGKWLMMPQNSGLITNDLKVLPDTFTVQYDLLCTTPFAWSSDAFHFAFGQVVNPTTFNTRARLDYTLGDTANRVFWLTLHPGPKNPDGYLQFLFENGESIGWIKSNYKLLDWVATRDQRLIKMSVWRQHQRVRVYINEKKLIDIPNLLPDSFKVNAVYIFAGGMEGDDKYFVGNLRAATGDPNARNRLMTGRLVTTGILFDVGSDQIRPESYGVLKEIAGLLREAEGLRVKITGHTDSDGDAAKNLALSKARAESVKKALATDFGITEDRMETDGKGATQPVAPNTTAQNKANNRRVVFEKI